MPRRPNELSLRDKRQMLTFYDTGGLRDMCESSAARLLDVSKRTMKMVLADRRAIEADGDPPRDARTDGLRKELITDLNNIMFQCFTEMINLNLPLDDTILLDRARRLAAQMDVPDFVPDMAWIACWKETRRIPAEHVYSRTRESVIAENSTWHRGLVEYAASNYGADDVYGLVEIGLHYVASAPAEPGAPPFAEPDYTVRSVCAVYVCNVTGTDKRTPLVFDRSHRFNGVSPLPDSNHINFHMLKTGEYKSYIRQLDMSIAPRRVLLVLDNYSEHPRIRLRNIELRVLPRGTIHPLGVLIADVRRADDDEDGLPPSLPTPPPMQPPSTPPPMQPPSTPPPTQPPSDAWDALGDAYRRSFLRVWDTITPAMIRDCFRTLRFLDAEDDVGAGLLANQQRQTVIAHTSSAQSTLTYDRNAPSRSWPAAGNSRDNDGPLIPTSVLNIDGNDVFDYGYAYGHRDCR